MKKLFLMTIFISTIFFACSKSDQTRWVDANAGLRLRMEPSTESQQIDLIPDGEKVVLLKENKNEVMINNKTGHWVQIKWNDKIGWAFDGFLTNQNLNRWVTTKTGLPYYNEIKGEHGVIPFKEKIKFVGPGKWEKYVIVSWKGNNLSVRNEFLSNDINFTYDNSELRKVASEKLTASQRDKIYPEDMFIESNKWLYHIIYISRNQDSEKDYLESLWFNDGNSWKEIELFGSNHDAFSFKMYNLDEDDNPDILIHGGCCDSYSIEVFLGTSDKKLNKIFEAHGVDYPENFNEAEKNEPDSPSLVSTGKCEKTAIEFKKKKYIFDCSKKQFI